MSNTKKDCFVLSYNNQESELCIWKALNVMIIRVFILRIFILSEKTILNGCQNCFELVIEVIMGIHF